MLVTLVNYTEGIACSVAPSPMMVLPQHRWVNRSRFLTPDSLVRRLWKPVAVARAGHVLVMVKS